MKKSLLIKMRCGIAIIGVFIFYNFIHGYVQQIYRAKAALLESSQLNTNSDTLKLNTNGQAQTADTNSMQKKVKSKLTIRIVK